MRVAGLRDRTALDPLRYGVNILEWNRDHSQANAAAYAYGADAITLSKARQHTFFAFEWVNPRLGKVIQEIRLKGASSFRTIAASLPPKTRSFWPD